jgi:tetratricopeptide (TPR) repeat protein
MADKWIFNFRIRPPIEGEPMTLKEAERYLLARLNDPALDPQEVRLELVRFYGSTGSEAEAMRYADEYLGASGDMAEKARVLFHQGQMMEHLKDWETSLWFYKKALELGTPAGIDLYFVLNNIGFCMNQLGRHVEAEPYLLEAIRLDPSRANAFKNLGLSFQGQGRYVDAALRFIEAVRADAADPRALSHLEDLVVHNKEVYRDIPDLDYQIFKCREAVEYASSNQPARSFSVDSRSKLPS